MKSQDDNLCHQLALGWSLQFLIKVATLLLIILRGILLENDFAHVKGDPGKSGFLFILYQYWFFAIIPILIYAVRGYRSRIARWSLVGVAILVLVLSVLHHLSHTMAGIRPNLHSHVMDLVIEMNLIWILVISVKWARMPAGEPAPQARSDYAASEVSRASATG
jgi:hypothetical protein